MRTLHATKPRMWLPLAGAAMLAMAVSIPMGLQSCQATHNADGTITIVVSPDTTITANGLEDALMQLVKLLNECILAQPDCSADQLAALTRAIEIVGNLKSGFSPRPPPPPVPPQPKPTPPPQPGG